MSSWKQRGENSFLLTLELGRDALGKRIQPTKTIRIEDPALLKSINRVDEYFREKGIRPTKTTPIDDPVVLRAQKKIDEYFREQLFIFKQEHMQGDMTGVVKIGFFELVEDWYNKHVLVHLAEKTQDNYLFHVNSRILKHFERKWIDEITTRFISDYLHSLRAPNARLDGKGPVKSATIVYNYRILKSIFKFAVAEKYLTENPMIGISKPPENDIKEMQVYDEQEIVELFNALEGEPIIIRVLIILAITTGLRRGEMAGLEWTKIDFDNAVLFVSQTIPKFKDRQPVFKGPKNKNSIRRISISNMLMEELQALKGQHDKQKEDIGEAWEGGSRDFVFRQPNGIPLSPQRLTNWWIEFHRRHKLKPIRLHDLRHTSVSWMIFKKVHSEAISKITGHKNTKMISIYGHIFDSVNKAAAAVFDEIPVPKKKIDDHEHSGELSTDCPPNPPKTTPDHQVLH